MGHLLYSSNEMYSSTDLIRKSKTIFNKIIAKEIDKAIILRDGKPSFMLLDFDKYEKIMAEYDELKANLNMNKNTTPSTSKIKKEIIEKSPKEIKSKSEPIEKVGKEDKVTIPQIKKIQPSHVVPPTPKYTEEDEEEIIEDDKIVEVSEPIIKMKEENKESEEDKSEKEVQEGLEVLEDLDFDDEFKKEVEKKVRERQIQLQAIKKIEDEKKALKEQEENEEDEDIFEDEIDLEMEKLEKERAKRKKTELKEFWA